MTCSCMTRVAPVQSQTHQSFSDQYAPQNIELETGMNIEVIAVRNPILAILPQCGWGGGIWCDSAAS